MSNYSNLKFIILLTLSVIASANVCRYKDEVFVADPLSCETYYWCQDETPNQQRCPPGYFFNPRLKWCDYPDNAECEAVTCEAGRTYLTPVPRNCDVYVSCAAGVGKVEECKYGELFNSVTLKCEDEDKVFCNTCPLRNPSYPVFLPNKSDCNAYYVCNNGQAVPMKCDSKLEWSEWEERCLLPGEAFCMYK